MRFGPVFAVGEPEPRECSSIYQALKAAFPTPLFFMFNHERINHFRIQNKNQELIFSKNSISYRLLLTLSGRSGFTFSFKFDYDMDAVRVHD